MARLCRQPCAVSWPQLTNRHVCEQLHDVLTAKRLTVFAARVLQEIPRQDLMHAVSTRADSGNVSGPAMRDPDPPIREFFQKTEIDLIRSSSQRSTALGRRLAAKRHSIYRGDHMSQPVLIGRGLPCCESRQLNQMKSDMHDVKVENQVLVAGAGPCGLALAAELSRRGVSAAIIDRQAAGANTSRACVVHAQTMEVLEPLGVTRDLLVEGVKVPIFRIRDRDRLLLTIDFSTIPSAYQFTLMIPQNRVEQILLRHLEDLGRSLMRPCELISYSTLPSQI